MTRNRMWWSAAVVLLIGAGAGAAVAWWARPGHNDFTEAAGAEGATALQTGDGWVLEAAQVAGEPCSRVRIGARSTTCMSLHFPAGSGQFGEVQGLGHRFVVVAWASATPVSAAIFTSRSLGAEHRMVSAATGVYVVAVELQPGEEAWGVHVLDADRAVVLNGSLLPP